jgi:TRAP-type mannitol/chloroaromatic compound transport system permease large subunit
MGDIYRSVIPYTLVELFGLAIIIAFPALVLWLPALVYAR